jgi:hypothetical protein
MKRLALAAVGLALVVGLVVVAVWASAGDAPWEESGAAPPSPTSPSHTPAAIFSKAEVTGIAAQRISVSCGNPGLVPWWSAAYTGSGVWQVCAICLLSAPSPSSLFYEVHVDPETERFPCWSFRESSERIIPLNEAARQYYVR